MSQPLSGKTIALLAADGVEQSEFMEARQTLKRAGANVLSVAPTRRGTIQSWRHFEKGDRLGIDLSLALADPEAFDGLVLPGGILSPDGLRANPLAVRFVRGFVVAGKPIAAMCHSLWTLIEAGGVRGRKLTSSPSVRTDLLNAGADWMDEAVVSDRGLVTSRTSGDTPVFMAKVIEQFGLAVQPIPA